MVRSNIYSRYFILIKQLFQSFRNCGNPIKSSERFRVTGIYIIAKSKTICKTLGQKISNCRKLELTASDQSNFRIFTQVSGSEYLIFSQSAGHLVYRPV